MQHARTDDFERRTTEMRRPYSNDEEEQDVDSNSHEQQLLQDILLKLGVSQRHWYKFFE